MRTSYSQNNTYITCPKAWYWQYVEGYQTEIEGSSLYFGTAIDRAVSDMLDNKPDWLKSFYFNWDGQMKNGSLVKIFDNDKITYSHKDFDADLLESKDYIELEKWAKELNLIAANAMPTSNELVKLFKDASKAKSSPYLKMTDEQFKYFNRCSWIGLKRKGKILLNAFHQQVVPKIKRVLSTQKQSRIEDPNTGDQVVGFVDMILELEGYDKPIIFDLKTSSFPYEVHQLETSPQLTLYAAMEAQNINTDLVGYIVLNKNIPKDEVHHCIKCGTKKNTRHQTCNATLADNSRCGGSWVETKVPKPEVQIMVDKKSQEQINDLLIDTGNIIMAMKNGIIYKNTSKCDDWYGSKCPFYGVCHKNDSTGLTKKQKSSKY